MQRNCETREQSNKTWQLDSLVTLTLTFAHATTDTPNAPTRTVGPSSSRFFPPTRKSRPASLSPLMLLQLARGWLCRRKCRSPSLCGRAPPGSEGRAHVHRSARCRRRRLRSVSGKSRHHIDPRNALAESGGSKPSVGETCSAWAVRLCGGFAHLHGHRWGW